MQDIKDSICRRQAIAEAVKKSGGKTVIVTVRKDGINVRFRTDSDSLTTNRDSYSTYSLSAKDLRSFEKLFGQFSRYTAEDIIRITYKGLTIYEAPPIQSEDMAQEIGINDSVPKPPEQGIMMGGMC